MEIFLIIVILGLITRYSVRAHFSHKNKDSKAQGTNPLNIDKTLFLHGIATIDITHPGLKSISQTLSQSVYGGESYIRILLAACISQGHCIIQGPPGTGKTSLVKAFSQACDLSYNRIQCTPDLLPQDILGNEILQQTTNTLIYTAGPIFSQVLHVDEINRTTPKLQSAFLEAMQEGQITMFGKTYPLPKPFFLVATQNPNDAIGTYMLPYAQIDRFALGIITSHVSADVELQLIKDNDKGENKNDSHQKNFLHAKDIIAIQDEVQKVHIDDSLLEYAVSCIQQIKKQGFDLSVRATKALVSFAKALAYLQSHTKVTKDDIQMSLLPVIAHRIHYFIRGQIDSSQVYEIMIGSLQKDDIVG